jgi:hypothetical protein
MDVSHSDILRYILKKRCDPGIPWERWNENVKFELSRWIINEVVKKKLEVLTATKA